MSELVALQPNRSVGAAQRVTPAVLVFALLALAAIALWPTLRGLEAYWRQVHDYHHGYLIALVTLGWLYTRRRDLDGRAPVGSWPAVALLAAAVALWLVAVVAASQIGQQLLLPVILALTVWAGAGAGAAHSVLRPLAYLYFAVPVWDFLAPLLQQMTVFAAQSAMALGGVPTIVRDVTVRIPEGTFQIIEGCSGKKYLVAALATAALAAAVAQFDRRRFWALIASAGALAILANWIRVITVITVGHLSHMQSYLVRVEHRSFGNAIWVLLLIAVLAIARRLSPAAPAPEGAPSAQDGGPAPVRLPATLFALALLLAGAAALAFVDQRRVPVDATLPPLPLSADAWQGPLPPSPLWRPQYAGAAVERRGAYEAGGERVEVYANVYGLQQPGRKPTSYENQLFAPGDWNAGLSGAAFGACGAAVGARPCLVGALDPDLHRWVISYRYYVGRTQTASPALAQALYGIAAIATVPPSGIVAAATRCADETCETARARLTAFWRQMDGTLSAVTGAASATVAAQAGE